MCSANVYELSSIGVSLTLLGTNVGEFPLGQRWSVPLSGRGGGTGRRRKLDWRWGLGESEKGEGTGGGCQLLQEDDK